MRPKSSGLFLKHLKSTSTNRLEPYGGGEPSLFFLRPREKARLVKHMNKNTDVCNEHYIVLLGYKEKDSDSFVKVSVVVTRYIPYPLGPSVTSINEVKEACREMNFQFNSITYDYKNPTDYYIREGSKEWKRYMNRHWQRYDEKMIMDGIPANTDSYRVDVPYDELFED